MLPIRAGDTANSDVSTLQTTSTPEDLRLWIRRLNSNRTKLRDLALAEAHLLSDQSLQSLLAAATAPIDKVSRRLLIFNPILWNMLLMPAACGVLAQVHRICQFDFDRAIGAVILISVFGSSGVLFHSQVTEPTRLWKALRNLVAQRDHPGLLGPVLELHFSGEYSMKGPGKEPWTSILPAIQRMVRRMRSEDYLELSISQRSKLLGMLRRPIERPELSMALLEMLSTVTDKRAMERVTKVARFEAASPMEKVIRDAALQCLRSMQLRSADERHGDLLLRPSDDRPDRATDLLVRPVGPARISSAPDKLLRSSDAG